MEGRNIYIRTQVVHNCQRDFNKAGSSRGRLMGVKVAILSPSVMEERFCLFDQMVSFELLNINFMKVVTTRRSINCLCFFIVILNLCRPD